MNNLRQLTGGASHETWVFDASIEGSDGRVRDLPLVLRSDLRSGVRALGRDVEYRILEAVGAQGVPVPRVHLMGDDSLGVPFFLMEYVAGETIPRRILRDDTYAGVRPSLTRQLGAILAKIHRTPIVQHRLDVLLASAPDAPPAAAEWDRWEQLYRGVTPDPHPAFELAFRWLRQQAPRVAGEADTDPRGASRTLVHGDYRLGNVIVGPAGVRAVLDWELAHLGDPMEDLAWLCMRSWRFGNDHLPAAGIGTREELWEAYEAAGGTCVDPRRARVWEAFGNLRWGIICIMQARPYLDKQSSSLELASIGRRVAETEWELLNLMEAS